MLLWVGLVGVRLVGGQGWALAQALVSEPGVPVSGPGVLEAWEVLDSLEQFHPQFESYRLLVQSAQAQVRGAGGEWDLRLDVRGETHPLKPYHLADATVAQPLQFWGIDLFAGWQMSRNDLPGYKDLYAHTYLGKKEIYTGPLLAPLPGLVHAGLTVPLLQGRAIDKRRLELFKAEAEEQEALAKLDEKQLELELKAIETYWDWVEAGRVLEVTQVMLQQAEDRQGFFEGAAQAGAESPLYVIENQKTIFKRQADVVEARGEFEKQAVKLSLYVRTDTEPHEPLVVRDPAQVGPWLEVEQVTQAQAREQALARARELPAWQVLQAKQRKNEAELEFAQNQGLPELDFTAYAGQPLEVGAKSDVALKVFFSLPLQRSAATGDQEAREADRVRLEFEQRWVSEQMVAAVLQLQVALEAARQVVGLKEQEVALMIQLAVAEREKFELGASSLFLLNQREQNSLESQMSLINSRRKLMVAYSQYLIALGLSLRPLYPAP